VDRWCNHAVVVAGFLGIYSPLRGFCKIRIASFIMLILIGFFLAVLIALAAFAAGALSISGMLAAIVLGTVVFGLGGWGATFMLLMFFISSSLLSKLFKKQKSKAEEKFSKGSRRDAMQVLANGGVAGLFVLLMQIYPGSVWVYAGLTASLAAANADTWATELGILNPTAPHLITTGKEVEPGTSGAVSPAGILAAFTGSLMVTLVGLFFFPVGEAPSGWIVFTFGILMTFAGVAGSLVDSWLGATLQAIYHCPQCGKDTEKHPLHTCGTATDLVRGEKWLNNDWVNIACTLSGGLVGALLASVFTFII
jgi:uncharacterized protein (TIGR00297 family)